MKARDLIVDKITTFSQTQPVYTKEKLADNILLALKEMVESMPRTPYINKCCQKTREDTITAVAELFGGSK
jgi:hypothetical protein